MRINFLAFCLATTIFCSTACTQPQQRDVATDNNPAPSTELPIRISEENRDAAEPVVAAATDGSAYTVWVEHLSGGTADVYLSRIAPDKTRATPVRVNHDPGVATAWRGDPPSIAIAKDGAIYIAWTGKSDVKSHDTNLYLSTSRDSGKTFEPPIKVNDDPKPARHGMHSIAMGHDGRVHLAWLDERNIKPSAPMGKHRGEMAEKESNNEVFTAYSDDGGRTVSRNQLIASEACPCCKTAVTTSNDGHVYIGWRQVLKGDYRHIAVAASTDRGQTYSPPVIVADDQWVIAACPVSGPSLSAGDGGALRVLWYTEGKAGDDGLYIAQSRDGAKTFAGRQLVSKGNVRGNPALVAKPDGKSFAAIWQASGAGSTNVMKADISADGAVGNVTTSKTGGDLPSASASGSNLFVAYIVTLNKQRTVWLERSGKS
jgi:hypothetical protein